MSRLPHLWIGSNLKMYKTNHQLLEFVSRLQELTADLPRENFSLFILAPYTGLAEACRLADPNQLIVGAQNMHWEEQGQFTGEISPLMLRDIGVGLVMIGHAERREKFGETDGMVNCRVHSSLAHGFTTLICVGETAADKAYGVSVERLRQQLKIALHAVRPDQLERVWVAYEPVWAIGEGSQPSDPDYANRMHAALHETLCELFPSHGAQVPILYGGSVNLENCIDLIRQPCIDGLFIGRAAWVAEDFNTIIRTVLPVWQENTGEADSIIGSNQPTKIKVRK